LAIAYWGKGCPANNNRYKVYLTSQSADAADSDLSNEGGNQICNVDQTTLECLANSLTDGTTYYWQVEANNGSARRLSAIWAFTVGTSANPWWQTKDGDVHAQGNISSEIPDTCNSSCNPDCLASLSLEGGGGSPGVVSYGGSLDTGSGEVSSTAWQANTAYLGPAMKFDYLLNRLHPTRGTLPCLGSVCDIPSADGTYFVETSEEIQLTGVNNFPNKVIIFAKAPVKVKENITVQDKTNGGFFALITSGNLTFDPTVTAAQGVYLTDGVLSIPSSGTPPDVQFKGEGSFIAWGGVNLDRDLGAGNRCQPAALFTSRPDFFINAPKDFLFAPFFFQEVAP